MRCVSRTTRSRRRSSRPPPSTRSRAQRVARPRRALAPASRAVGGVTWRCGGSPGGVAQRGVVRRGEACGDLAPPHPRECEDAGRRRCGRRRLDLERDRAARRRAAPSASAPRMQRVHDRARLSRAAPRSSSSRDSRTQSLVEALPGPGRPPGWSQRQAVRRPRRPEPLGPAGTGLPRSRRQARRGRRSERFGAAARVATAGFYPARARGPVTRRTACMLSSASSHRPAVERRRGRVTGLLRCARRTASGCRRPDLADVAAARGSSMATGRAAAASTTCRAGTPQSLCVIALARPVRSCRLRGAS